MKNFNELLKSRDLKSTIQRLAILDIIEKAGHIGIDEIYANILQTHPSVSLNTIYLNIQTMCEKGILIEVPIQNIKSKYEIAKENHFHFICTNCGSVVDERKSMTQFDSMFLNISKNENFKMDSSTISIYGKCKNC